ncbi:MAG: hypothetical protein WC654_07775 [Patescibacteria group bacterium]
MNKNLNLRSKGKLVVKKYGDMTLKFGSNCYNNALGYSAWALFKYVIGPALIVGTLPKVIHIFWKATRPKPERHDPNHAPKVPTKEI